MSVDAPSPEAGTGVAAPLADAEARSVIRDAQARESAKTVAEVIGQALAEPFLPAAPDEGACRWCDYQTVCGPYEEQRTGRKWKPALEGLTRLRKLA